MPKLKPFEVDKFIEKDYTSRNKNKKKKDNEDNSYNRNNKNDKNRRPDNYK